MSTLSNALQALAPNSEYTDRDDTYANLEWHSDLADKPSKSQVDTEITRQQGLNITDYAAYVRENS